MGKENASNTNLEIVIKNRNDKVIILDTETVGELNKPIAYDIGFIVADGNGNIYEKRSFLIKELYDNPHRMSSAYYCKKNTGFYNNGLENGEIKRRTFQQAMQELEYLIRRYDAKMLLSYNAMFDTKALLATAGEFGDLPPKVQQIDKGCIWRMACETILDRNYTEYARAYGWLTDNGNVKTSAETAYRYLKQIPDYEENHTGLEDCLIEYEILLACLNSNKPYDATPKAMPFYVVYNHDTDYQMRNLERKESELDDKAQEIKKAITAYKGRHKTILEHKVALGLTTTDEEITRTIAEVGRFNKNEQLTAKLEGQFWYLKEQNNQLFKENEILKQEIDRLKQAIGEIVE